ncbi:MAG: ISAzo13 family transposase [Deltaproteobacteria bacterium]|nr:ISAzo13 family transposase [Deltaproteobacteria bacterium]
MDIGSVERKIHNIWPHLNERQRRLLAAAEAVELGHGGITAISEICGLSRVTITKGIKELDEDPIEAGKLRKPGSGRPQLLSNDPEIMDDLLYILEDSTRGDPENLICWTSKSTRNIAKELCRKGHKISYFKVRHLLLDLGYSLQSNRKVLEGKQHEDRDDQFKFINELCKKALNEGQPVLSVDTKKKELVGNHKNPGQQWREKSNPIKVNVHDFPDPDTPKAIPYGIYDIGRDKGYVNLGINHDTSTFAVNSISGWWTYQGSKFYRNPKYLVITADGGGSNGYRTKLWKVEIQALANKLGIPIHVSHFPPGTSKWNKVEHRLFSFISSNWKGEPLKDYETIVNLISHTASISGLKVICRLDRRKYKPGIKVSPDQFVALNLEPNKFHGEWNYILHNV